MSLAASASPRFERSFSTALLLVALGGALTGFAPIFARMSELGPLSTAGWRMAFAALTLLPLAALKGRTGRGAWGWIVLAGLFFAFDLGFYHLSLDFTSIAHATLIVNLAPLVALGAGYMLFGERLGLAKLSGLALAIGGAGAMTFGRIGTPGTLEGDALAALGLFGYALYLIVVKHARTRSDPATIMAGSSLVAAVALLIAAWMSGESLLPQTAFGIAVLVAMGLVSHALGQGLVAVGIGGIPVGLASIVLLTQPIVASVAAWGVFGETLGPVELLGAALTLAGIGLASRARS